ncbi:MAG: PrsW family intramembrane metalloprotease [Bacteroidetes bacterium]|nr:PrsW family intramembrane metalloprotease [Bacteroidota bacterium]
MPETEAKDPATEDLLQRLKGIFIEQTDEKHWYFRRPILAIFTALVAAVVVVNVFFIRPASLDHLSRLEQAKYYDDHNWPSHALAILDDLRTGDSLNIDNHFWLIDSHMSMPDEVKDDDSKKVTYRNDDSLTQHYYQWSRRSDQGQADIGFYCLGLIQSHLKHYPEALAAFASVKNRSLKYLNNSIGHVYLGIAMSHETANADSIRRAETFFRNEIALNGNLPGAASNLLKCLVLTDQWEEVVKVLSHDPRMLQYCPSEVFRLAYFNTNDFIGYINGLFRTLEVNLNWQGFIAALLILIAWLVYLRDIDLYGSEKWRYLIGTCVLGMLCSIIAFPLYDYLSHLIGSNYHSNILTDALYCVFGIGLIEESVKILPLLIGLLLFKDEIAEPIDFIIYASVSALGFAFVENLMYFERDAINIVHGRALISVFGHMFFSSIVAYGIILSRYKGKSRIRYGFLGGLLLAALCHGFFDFWLLSPAVKSASWISLVFMVFCVAQYAIFVSNALSISPYYSPDRKFSAHSLKIHLLYLLSSVLLIEYLFYSYAAGRSEGNDQLVASMFSGSFLMFWFSDRFGTIQADPSNWRVGAVALFRKEFRESELWESGMSALVFGVMFAFGFGFVKLVMHQPAYALIYAAQYIISGLFRSTDKDEKLYEAETSANRKVTLFIEKNGDQKILCVRCADVITNVIVCNGDGGKVLSQQCDGKAGEDQLITLPDLPPGKYTMSVDTDNGVETASFSIIE